jgi:D-arabinose 5-phosphate isomerase GutQ
MITSKREAAYKLIMEADAFLKSSVSGTSAELVEINAALSEHGERLTAVESSAKQAHHRIDEIVGDKK